MSHATLPTEMRPVSIKCISVELMEQEPLSSTQQAASSEFGKIVRGALLALGAAGVLTLLAFSLLPVVFVTLLFFLPAVAPILLVVLGMLLTGKGTPREELGEPHA